MLSLLESFVLVGWQVTFASPALQGEHKVDLTTVGITERNITLNCSSFDDFILELKPDVVLFDRFMLEEQFGWRVAHHCPQALRILDTEDLHSLRQARHSVLKQQRELSTFDLNSDLAKREIAAIFRCDLSLIISEFEYQLLQNHYHVPKAILLHCPFMLNLSNMAQNITTFEQRQHFISIGNFRHEPNWDAVLWLKQSIWPLIRQQLPHTELHIYGAYPPQKATQLHNVKQGFLVKGWAANAEVVMSQARVCLAPLRFGAGLKGKLVEAMLCGTPSVTTSVGSEGMGLAPVNKDSANIGLNWPGHLVDFAPDQLPELAQIIAQQAISLYQDQNYWQQCQQLGYRWLSGHFDQLTLQPKLLDTIDNITANLDNHRANNFIGQMLQHHQLKSTQYMAQWIEAKNKNIDPIK
jgi:glycosyltransferase involved in cell wall biosynthesis